MSENAKRTNGFLWGVATAAYQVEGAVREANRGCSIWDTFSHTFGKTHLGQTGDVACDHYHLYKQDVALMKELGVNAYRFSVAWPRIVPDGSGPTNPAGVDFYSRLVDELLAAGIRPVCTLYHWDLPQTLEDRGGWRNRETSARFAEYASRLATLLGDRVTSWITLNEPHVIASAGYGGGVHAPGVRDRQAEIAASHVLNLAHGLAVQAIRAADPTGRAKIGITLNLSKVYPENPDREQDRAAASFIDARTNKWYLEPTFMKRYPEQVLDFYGRNHLLPRVESGDTSILSPPIDFLGINNYTRVVVRGGDSNAPEQIRTVNPRQAVYTEMGWEVFPMGLRDILVDVWKEYKPNEIMVTENGAAFQDEVSPDARIHDSGRVNYLKTYIEAAGQAAKAGVPLTGYFAWSLLDNFEWQHGYSKRFGIVYVDFATQKRIIKDSGYWYRDHIAAAR